MFFKVAQTVNTFLCKISEKICHQRLSKIAQSGHTECLIAASCFVVNNMSYNIDVDAEVGR